MTSQPGEIIKPPVTKEEATRLIRDLYGMNAASLKELNSYDDKNYFFKPDGDVANQHVGTVCENGYILKVTNSQDSKCPEVFDGQNEMILHLAKAGMTMPTPIKNKSGALKSLEMMSPTPGASPRGYLVRVLEFVPGKILYDVRPWTARHFFEVGKFVARMDRELQSFTHPGLADRKHIWFLSSIPQLRDYLHALENAGNRKLVSEIIAAFEAQVVPEEANLARGVIHGDANEQNVLMTRREADGEYEVSTVIDFGDSHVNPLVFELAITIMYMMTKSTVVHPNAVGGHVIAGYVTERKLPDLEMSLLRTLVASRYAQSMTLGAYSYAQDPGNEYLLTTTKDGWRILGDYWSHPSDKLYAEWNAIMGQYS